MPIRKLKINPLAKTSYKILSIILGIIAINLTITLIPDKTKKKTVAFSKEFPFQKKISISEKFTTDFESSYGIQFSLEDPNPYPEKDSLLPIKTNLEILLKEKPVAFYINHSFESKAGAEYELKMNFINKNSKPNILRLEVLVDVPGPSYELLVEREYKWIFWVFDALLVLIALITGYFGFRKKASSQ